ncbi:hypothetical protein FBR02_05055 [Anaerolineae bacterium CFX9]|nr:hypothetical protein [Anaerolineae bacterium CFX9]
MKRFLPAVICLLLAAACASVEVAPGLSATPGPAFTVADGWYRNERWQAQYPDGWRVISGAATDNLSVIFAAPDDCTLILLSETEAPAPQPPGCTGETITERQTVERDGTTIYTLWLMEADQADAVRGVIQRVLDSIAAAA